MVVNHFLHFPKKHNPVIPAIGVNPVTDSPDVFCAYIIFQHR